jgi:hypothetical protein
MLNAGGPKSSKCAWEYKSINVCMWLNKNLIVVVVDVKDAKMS